ncbi:FxsA family protein [Paracoccus sp. (in: a-proteobacteria)]|uniref:FxsA family protein n=1 Tax=Paracoccus sp. TaxID=267 RepID=UPI003A854ACD
MWLVWLFIIVPIIEIALFIQVGGLIGLWPTLAIVVTTAVVGTALMRSQGASAWLEVQRSFAEMSDPSRPLAHGVMIVIAGMLLVTPGFFTDSIGLLLLIPGVRDWLMRRIASRIQVSRVDLGFADTRPEPHRPPYGDGVIDGDYVVEDEPGSDRPMPPDLPPPDRGPRGKSGWTRH